MEQASGRQRDLQQLLDRNVFRREERVIDIQVGRAGEAPRTSFDMKVPMSTTTSKLKAMIQDKAGIAAENQRITCPDAQEVLDGQGLAALALSHTFPQKNRREGAHVDHDLQVEGHDHSSW